MSAAVAKRIMITVDHDLSGVLHREREWGPWDEKTLVIIATAVASLLFCLRAAGRSYISDARVIGENCRKKMLLRLSPYLYKK